MKYERLTNNLVGICYCNNGVDCKIPCHECWYKKVFDRLVELEDKIENGTLAELPYLTQDREGNQKLYFFDDRHGGINCYTFFNKEAAEAKFKELKGEE